MANIINLDTTYTIGTASRPNFFDSIRQPAVIRIKPKPPLPGQPGYGAHIMKKIKDTAISDMYCVSCRERKINIECEKVEMKNGKPALKAKCPDCGTGMYKIGSI